MKRKFSYLLFACLVTATSYAQPGIPCTTVGQTPSTAFPVCGTSIFVQNTVPLCRTDWFLCPCAPSNASQNYYGNNPFWYKFHCYTAGVLGFLITPNTLTDDYDWQLFDITGHNPNDISFDASLFVSCNWSGLTGITGAGAGGSGLINCSGFVDPIVNRMPMIYQDHDYLLVVSHFNNTQDGYQLSFTPGLAVITNSIPPELKNAGSDCNGVSVIVTLNKKMKCSSLAADGSDFSISPATASVVSASGIGCSNGFEMDSVILVLSAPLGTGNYTITIKDGTDGNTLLDNCGDKIPIGATLSFFANPLQPSRMDRIGSPSCIPDSIELFFNKPIYCSSVAADGSDFILSGASPVTINSARAVCNNTIATSVILKFSASPSPGNYQVQIASGSDGNTVLDACNRLIPAGSSLPITIPGTVSAQFQYNTFAGCLADTIRFLHNGANAVNSWSWVFNSTNTLTAQNPVVVFPAVSTNNIKLIVSNGSCTDSTTATIVLNNEVRVGFDVTAFVCPGDNAMITNTTTGIVSNWQWDFGNGNSSLLQSPLPQQYAGTGMDVFYSIRLIVDNGIGCSDTLFHAVKVLGSCRIAVPSAFTPNNDGLNDYLYPVNAFRTASLDFKVYNRWGQVVFHSNDWQKKWDGKINGILQNTGTYAWTLNYTDKDTGQKHSLRGTATLIR